MNLKDITIVTAIDNDYIDKLLHSYQTWVHFKPEITTMPMRIIYDRDSLSLNGRRMRKLCALTEAHRDFRFIAWGGKYETQREKMLTSLVFATVKCVDTSWYMKIDADTIATSAGAIFLDEWLSKSSHPAFITNPWGYTKPASFVERLEKWGDTVPKLSDMPRLGLKAEVGAKRLYHPRIISWLYFGNTAWTGEVASLMTPDRLPVPSQDTTLWYCAERLRDEYVTYRMKNLGWGHMGRKSISHISQKVQELLHG